MCLIKVLLDSFDDRQIDAVQLNVLNVNREMLDLMKQLDFEIDYSVHRLYSKRDEGLMADFSIVYSFGIV